MKLLSVALFLSLVVTTACSSVPASCTPPWSKLARSEIERTVAFVRPDGDGKVSTYCSGVWLSRSTIVTAAHCVDGAELDTLYVLSYGHDTPIPAMVSASDPGADIAIVEAAPLVEHDVASLGPSPEAGDPVSAVGHPLGMRWSFSCGHVAAVRDFASTIGEDTVDITWIQATTPISPGSSGGGLWDAAGRLIGIASRSFTRGQNMNLFVPVRYLPSASPGAPEPDPTLLAPPEKAPEAQVDQPTP